MTAAGDSSDAAARKRDAETQAGLDEACDLSRTDRLHIFAALRDLRERSYWEVLGLFGDPTEQEIKRAFFEASKRFHPDRYFGKKLGSFATRLDEVFRGVKDAYETLSDATKRAAYSRKHPPPRARAMPVPGRMPARNKEEITPPPAPLDDDTRRRLEERRAEIVAGRKPNASMPFGEQLKRAKDLFELGTKQMHDRDITGAAASFRLAAAYAPNNAEFQARYEEAQQAANQLRVKDLVEQADRDLGSGRVGAAAKLFAEAAELVPSMISLALRAADCFERTGDAASARDYAKRAVENSPRRPEARVLLARLLEAQGDLEGAVTHLEAAAALDANDSHVKKTLKRLRQARG